MATQPSNSELMERLQAIEGILKKHLPEAVSAKQDREEVRLKDARRKASAVRAVANLAGRKG